MENKIRTEIFEVLKLKEMVERDFTEKEIAIAISPTNKSQKGE